MPDLFDETSFWRSSPAGHVAGLSADSLRQPGKCNRSAGVFDGKQWVEALNRLLQPRGKMIVPRKRLYDWQVDPTPRFVRDPATLPAGARAYLTPENPTLLALEQRYAKCDPDVITPLIWTKQHVLTEDITYFRSENAYVWQLRGMNSHIVGYALATYYALSIDRYNLFSVLQEDDAFGCITFDIGGHRVSRDLLDSIIEIDFLDRHLGLMGSRPLTILDIGAGYGRLAHRTTTAVQGLAEYICTDAVPCSSFINEYYLEYRKSEKSTVVPLDRIEKRLERGDIDIAINIHSFSECRMEAIDWWVCRVARAGIKHFFIVPNRYGLERGLLTNDKKDFLPILSKHGYRLVLQEPKYFDPVVQQYALSPEDYFLFQLN
jgi:hypothetical protein